MTTAWRRLLGRGSGDWALPAAVLLVGVGELVARDVPRLPLAVATYVSATAVLVGRRRWPAAMPVVVASISIASGLLGGAQAFLDAAAWLLPPVLASFAAGLHVPRRRAWVGLLAVVAALGLWTLALVGLAELDADPVFGLVMYVAPWVAGVAMRMTLDRNTELAVDAERARQERSLAAAAAARAADEERLRIARDLHDVLAHSLTAMVVQASVAEDLLTTDAEAAGRALRHVQDRGRAVLDETGRLLRAERGLAGHMGHGPGSPAALGALVADFRRVGLDVEADLAGLSGLPPHVAVVVERVLEEGLTNVLRHCEPAAADLRVRRDPDSVEVAVANRDGCAVRRSPDASGAGLGLLGLRERVQGCGGRLDVHAGPGPFTLVARLPLEASTWTA